LDAGGGFPMLDDSPRFERIPLAALATDEEAQIAAIEGEASMRQRLEEMGLRTGAVIRMMRSRPPHIIALNGRRLCLRTNAELQVWVETVSAAGAAIESP
jgi:ferrous iron transport protein A